MRAMVLEKIGSPLKLKEVEKPKPGKGEILLEVSVCGVCRTDLHIFDGDLPQPHLPLILGHQIVGTVVEVGPGVKERQIGERVGVPWLGGSCQACGFCRSGEENLCDNAVFTGYHKNGGYAEYCVADEHYCFPLPKNYKDQEAAPLLCAGMIGYRAFRFTKGKRLGIYGFGASAHIIMQIALAQGREVYVFTRKPDDAPSKFAKELGATWVGTSETLPPELLDAAIIFAPVGALYPQALKALNKGGTVISAGIHMSDIPSFPYKLLWEERSMRSVANLTLQDGKELLKIATEIPLKVKVNAYPLEKANDALKDLREGKFLGAAVLTIRKN